MKLQQPHSVKPGQESVWDYPRPPRLEPTAKHIQVIHNDLIIVDTHRAWRVLETSHPPTYYLPPEDVQLHYLTASTSISWCEWKGQAVYFDLVLGQQRIKQVAWAYPNPTPGFKAIKNHLAFYPQLVDRCLVDGEVVLPQPGGFYGGWITSDIVGPFKGGPGSSGW